MTQVSGRKMVTPWAIRRRAVAARMVCVQVHHLGDGVGAQHLVHAPGLQGHDALAVGDQQGGNVRQVELAVGVVGGEQVELAEERRGLEAVDAGVDLAGGELGGRERLLLDDGDAPRAGRA